MRGCSRFLILFSILFMVGCAGGGYDHFHGTTWQETYSVSITPGDTVSYSEITNDPLYYYHDDLEELSFN